VKGRSSPRQQHGGVTAFFVSTIFDGDRSAQIKNLAQQGSHRWSVTLW